MVRFERRQPWPTDIDEQMELIRKGKIMKSTPTHWILALFAIVIFGASGLSAGTIQVQKTYGTSSNSFPFTTNSMTYAYIIEKSEIGAVTGDIIEWGFDFSGAYNRTWASGVKVWMGQTSNTSASMSTTFANNFNLDPATLVIDGSLTINTTGAGFMRFTLDNPYKYTGAGNLSIRISLPNAGSPAISSSIRHGSNAVGRRVFSSGNANATTGSSSTNFAHNFSLLFKTSSTWTGEESSDWTDPENWEDDELPDDETGALIPDASTTTNDPILPSGITLESLELESGAVLVGNTGSVTILKNYTNLGGTYTPMGSELIFGGTDDQEITTDGSSIGSIRVTNTMGNVTILDEFSAANTGTITLDANTNLYFSDSTLNFSGASFNNQGMIHLGLDGGGTMMTLQTISANGQNIGNANLRVIDAMDGLEFNGDIGFANVDLSGAGTITFNDDLYLTSDLGCSMSGDASIAGALGEAVTSPTLPTGSVTISGTGAFNVGLGVHLQDFTHIGSGIVDLGANVTGANPDFFQVSGDVRFESITPTARVDVRLDIDDSATANISFDSSAPVEFSPVALSNDSDVNDVSITGVGDVTIGGGIGSLGVFTFNSTATLSVSGGFSVNDATIQGDGLVTINNNFTIESMLNLSGTASLTSGLATTTFLMGDVNDNASGGTISLGALVVDDGASATLNGNTRTIDLRSITTLATNSASAQLHIGGTVRSSGIFTISETTSMRLLQGATLDLSGAVASLTNVINGVLETQGGGNPARILGSANSARFPRIDVVDAGVLANTNPALSLNGLILENFGADTTTHALRIGVDTNVLAFNDVRFENLGQTTDAVVLETFDVPSLFSGLYFDGQAVNNFNADAIFNRRIDITEAQPDGGNLFGAANEVDTNNVLMWDNPPVMAILTSQDLPNGLAENAYSTTITFAGGNLPGSFALNNAPSFLSINATTGEITGTPGVNDVGIHTFAVTVTDSSMPSGSANQTFNLQIDALTTVALTIISEQDLPDGEVNKSYRHTLGAVGGVGPYVWTIQDSSALPPGIALSGNTGEILGSTGSANAGLYTFLLRVTDQQGSSATKLMNLRIQSEFSAPGTIAGALSDGGGGCAISERGSSSIWFLMALAGILGLAFTRRRSEA